jgi:phosphoesterase RecJ-like protein
LNMTELEAFQEAKNEMLRAQRILIISHKNPDADSIGANCALKEALEHLGKQVDSACIDPVPASCTFLKGAELFLQDFHTPNYDLIISVDCGGYKLLGFHEEKPELLDKTKVKLINIDHHPSNDRFGTINIVMETAPATCFILYLMFSSFGWEIKTQMATALMHGLYYDTGCFMHSNTCAQTLRIAARLKALGADHERCVKEQFKSTSLNRLRLWGRALSKINLNSKQAAVTAVTEKDYAATQSNYEDLSGCISYLSHAAEARFCMLLSEDQKGNIKGSLRTQEDTVNVAKIAELFGGGGHTKAAGFTIPGHLKEKYTWELA